MVSWASRASDCAAAARVLSSSSSSDIHFAQQIADGVHGFLASIAQNDALRGREIAGLAQVDRLLKLSQFVGDQRRERVDARLLPGIVRDQFRDVPANLFGPGTAVRVRRQIAVDARDHVAALTGLGILQARQKLGQLILDLARVGDPNRGLGLLGHAPVGDCTDDHEDRQRDGESEAYFGADIPFHERAPVID